MTIEFDGNFRQPEDIIDLTTSVYKLISIFGENVTLNFRIKKGLEDSFDKKLQDLSNGKVNFSQIGEVIAGE